MSVQSIFKELKYEISKIEFVNAVLDTTIFLFILYFISLWTKINQLYLFLSVILFFLLDLLIRVRSINLKDVEKKNPVVADILRTAYDYKDYFTRSGQKVDDNVMVQGMYSDFSHLMKKVRTGTFINTKHFLRKAVLCMVLSFVIIFASVIQIDVEEFLAKSELELDDGVKFVQQKNEDIVNTYADVFGEETEIVKLKDEFFFDFENNNFQLDYDNQKNYDLRQFESYDEFYIDLESDTTFSEDISSGDRALVKAYFSD